MRMLPIQLLFDCLLSDDRLKTVLEMHSPPREDFGNGLIFQEIAQFIARQKEPVTIQGDKINDDKIKKNLE